MGPAVLVILAAVIATALLRARFKRSWRWIHRLNYVIFVAILVHGLILGTDLRSNLFLEICVGLYTALVVAGFLNRNVHPAGPRLPGK
jgi:DMSO/TMAO reductase YedYZ heme-binding membrane subunit